MLGFMEMSSEKGAIAGYSHDQWHAMMPRFSTRFPKTIEGSHPGIRCQPV